MADNFFTRMISSLQKPEPIKPMKQMGVPGFTVVGGYIQTKETNPKLIGEQKYITASNILANVSIVAAGMHHYLNLVSSPNWTVEPPDDTAEAKSYSEFVEECMYDMESSWKRSVRQAGMYRFHGFSVQEWTAKRREDGKIGYKSLEVRPQHTIQEWDLDNNAKVRGMWQWTPMTTGQGLYLPRAKTVYIVDDTLSDSPEGFGLVRHLVEPADRLTNYLKIEGQGFERDFRGVPIGYAPRAEIAKAIDDGTISKEAGAAMLNGLERMVEAQAKGEATGLVLDSSVYSSQTETGTNPSSQRLWGIELLTGPATGIEHVGAAIDRTNYDMAMIMGMEALLLGRESGNRSLGEDKSRNMYLMVNSCVGDIAEVYEKDFVDPLWTLNGFDPKFKPTLKPEDVSFRSVEEITAALRDMATAGAILAPDDPVVQDVRDLLGVSRQPEEVIDYLISQKEMESNGNREVQTQTFGG